MSEFSPRYLKDYQVPDFKIATVDLTVALNDSATIVTNVMTLTRNGSHQNVLSLDGEHMQLISVAIDGKNLDTKEYQLTENQLSINTFKDNFEVTIVTQIDPQANTALEGLYKSGNVYCTQCEAEGFRRITYFLDRPDVMATYTTKIIANKSQYPYLLANGNKIAAGDLDHGLHFVTWQDPFPKPCYLFALVAGDFDLLVDNYTTGSGKNVALELFVDKGNKNRGVHAMNALKKSMLWDEQEFNLEYDLDIYMIVAVDFFNMGAMENKGLNVFNSKFVLADNLTATDDDFFNVEAVIAHEYFHNWTGNRVTCRDWFQLSLKEGLTVFRDQQFSADMHSKAVTRIKNVRIVRSQQFAEDAGPMAHSIRPEKVMEMNNFYTLTVYEKGSEVIRMLHTLLGDKHFKAGVELYFKRYDGQAVTCDDFIQALADASGVDLKQFKLWYSQSGTPNLTISDEFDSTTNTYQLTVTQSHPETKDGQVKQHLHIPIKIELLGKEDEPRNQCLLELTEQQQTWCFKGYGNKPVPALLGDFSAPVKLKYSYSDEQLLALMMNASDEYNRWDAGQKLFANYLIKLTKDINTQLPVQICTAIRSILASHSDNAFKAEQLSLPSFDEMAAMINEVEPLSLIRAQSSLKKHIAEQLQDELLATYQECLKESFSVEASDIADRALKNVCLDYLAVLPLGNELVKNQYSQANNMTDQLAAIKASSTRNLECFDTLMNEFEAQWFNNALVMDKWFTINAMHANAKVLETLPNLLKHSQFTLENPNRARALIGAFAFYNPSNFHQELGQGYQFLADQIIKLNSINPQVASRILTPLIQFKSFSAKQQILMTQQLERIRNIEDLSRDLKEKLDAALK